MDSVSLDLWFSRMLELTITCSIPTVLVYWRLHTIYTTTSSGGLGAGQEHGGAQGYDYPDEEHRSEVGMPMSDGLRRAAYTGVSRRIDDLEGVKIVMSCASAWLFCFRGELGSFLPPSFDSFSTVLFSVLLEPMYHGVRDWD
jgi:hypothetical protein